MSACRHRRQRTPTFPSPTHQDQRNAPSHRSFPDARGRADLDPLIVTEGDAHSTSKPEPQPPRYTIFYLRSLQWRLGWIGGEADRSGRISGEPAATADWRSW